MSGLPPIPGFDRLIEEIVAVVMKKVRFDVKWARPNLERAVGRIGTGNLPPGVPTTLVPAAHASTHAAGGTDELTPAAIGAVADDDSRLSDSRTPSGTAGGVLGGTYPNPGFASDMATQAELDAVSATLTALSSTVSAITAASLHVPRIFAGWPTGTTAPAIGDHFGSLTHTADVNMTLTGIVGYAVTTASGTAATFDIEYKRGGGAWTTIFSVLPTFAVGTATPTSGTLSVTSIDAGDLFRLNWDAVNGLAGAVVQLKATTR